MRTVLTVAVALTVVLMLAGGVSLALTGPAWLCMLYGPVAAVGVWQSLEALGTIWKS